LLQSGDPLLTTRRDLWIKVDLDAETPLAAKTDKPDVDECRDGRQESGAQPIKKIYTLPWHHELDIGWEMNALSRGSHPAKQHNQY
jgi:hypothetical protein